MSRSPPDKGSESELPEGPNARLFHFGFWKFTHRRTVTVIDRPDSITQSSLPFVVHSLSPEKYDCQTAPPEHGVVRLNDTAQLRLQITSDLDVTPYESQIEETNQLGDARDITPTQETGTAVVRVLPTLDQIHLSISGIRIYDFAETVNNIIRFLQTRLPEMVTIGSDGRTTGRLGTDPNIWSIQDLLTAIDCELLNTSTPAEKDSIFHDDFSFTYDVQSDQLHQGGTLRHEMNPRTARIKVDLDMERDLHQYIDFVMTVNHKLAQQVQHLRDQVPSWYDSLLHKGWLIPTLAKHGEDGLPTIRGVFPRLFAGIDTFRPNSPHTDQIGENESLTDRERYIIIMDLLRAVQRGLPANRSLPLIRQDLRRIHSRFDPTQISDAPLQL